MEGGCVAKERKEIESVTESGGNGIRKNFYFLINQNVSKPQIILMPLSFKAEKKSKKQLKKREDDLQREKNREL